MQTTDPMTSQHVTPAERAAVMVVREFAEAEGTTLDEPAKLSGIAYRVEDLTSTDLVRMTVKLRA